MNFELNEAQKTLGMKMAEIFRQEILPRAGLLDSEPVAKKAELLRENLQVISRAGYFHTLLGEDLLGQAVAGEALAKTCGATYLAALISGVAFGVPLKIFGTEQQKASYLERLKTGELLGALAYSEAEGGSDLGGIRTRAVRKNGLWVIDGTKDLVTNAPLAHIFLVLAWTDDKRDLTSGMTFFLIPRDTPGLSVGEPVETMGLRGALTAPVSFTGCTLTDEAILGGTVGSGHGQLAKTLAYINLAMSTLSVGLGVACMETSTRHAKGRKAFGKPIGLFEGVGAKLAIMLTLTELGRMLTYRAAWAMEQGEAEGPILAAAAKLFTSEAASEIAHLALQVHGGHGYLQGNLAERLYRDTRFAEVAFGTSEMLRAQIAQDSLDSYQ